MRTEPLKFCGSLEGGFVAWIIEPEKMLVTQGKDFSELQVRVWVALKLLYRGGRDKPDAICFQEEARPELLLPREWKFPGPLLARFKNSMRFETDEVGEGHRIIDIGERGTPFVFYEDSAEPLKPEGLAQAAKAVWAVVKDFKTNGRTVEQGDLYNRPNQLPE